LSYSELTNKKINLIIKTLAHVQIDQIHPRLDSPENSLPFFNFIERIDDFYENKSRFRLYQQWLINSKDTKTFESFLNLVTALLEEKKAIILLKNDQSLDAWLKFWNRNTGKYPAHEIIQKLQYLSSNLIQRIHRYGSDIFDYLAAGKNIRHFDSETLFFTKKMAHIFHNTNRKDDLSTLHQFCASETLLTDDNIKNVVRRHGFSIGTTQYHIDGFRQLAAKLKQWNFIELDVEQQQAILGYISHGFQDIEGFSLQSATLNSITRRANAYYEDIARRRNRNSYFRNYTHRKGVNMKDFVYDFEGIQYQIIQLKTLYELTIEGRVLHHCVSGYSAKCFMGDSSIWSLRDNQDNRMVTIELKNTRIAQIKGDYNRSPNALEKSIIKTWAWKNKLQF